MTVDTEVLDGNYMVELVWQDRPDGVPEQALKIRQYSDRVLSIKQGDDEILINADSVKEIVKSLRWLASNFPEE